jgi:hypothetical protein
MIDVGRSHGSCLIRGVKDFINLFFALRWTLPGCHRAGEGARGRIDFFLP